MYGQPRLKKRTTYVKQVKNASIEWILNLLDTIPKYELENSNLRSIQEPQLLKVLESEPFKTGKVFTYRSAEGKFVQREFCLFQNMLVMLGDSATSQTRIESKYSTSFFLVLSGCVLEQKNIIYKEHEALGLQLSNDQGNTYLFFDTYIQSVEWYKDIKKYAKLTNFASKFTIKMKMAIPNFFVCTKNKNNRAFTVQIHKLIDLHKHISFYEALMNEIGVYMCCPRQSFFMNFRQVYEDKIHLYVVFEYWHGEQLSKVLATTRLSQVQMNSIMLQLIKAAKYLHNNGLYHGMITPNNIIISKPQINTQQRQPLAVRCLVYGFAYREQNSKDLYWLLKRTPPGWVAPELEEIYQEVQRKDKKQIKILSKYADLSGMDTYQIGCVLYLLTFGGAIHNYKQFMDSFSIDIAPIQEIIQGGAVSLQDYSQTLYSHSQLDLLVQLIHQSVTQRVQLQQASKHQWFVKQNRGPATQIIKQVRVLPSLRTILEIREQSSYELYSSRFGFENIEERSFSENEGDENDNLHKISKEHNTLQLMISQLPCRIQNASKKNQINS